MQLLDPLTAGSDHGASSPVNFSLSSLRFNGAPCQRVLCNGLSHREAQTTEVTGLKCSKRRLNCLETHEGLQLHRFLALPSVLGNEYMKLKYWMQSVCNGKFRRRVKEQEEPIKVTQTDICMPNEYRCIFTAAKSEPYPGIHKGRNP